MSVVSMVGDHYADKWRERTWFPKPQPYRVYPDHWPWSPPEDADELRRLRDEVDELKRLLKRAKQYDDDNHEPDCEVDEKMAILRGVAKLVGVVLDEALGRPN